MADVTAICMVARSPKATDRLVSSSLHLDAGGSGRRIAGGCRTCCCTVAPRIELGPGVRRVVGCDVPSGPGRRRHPERTSARLASARRRAPSLPRTWPSVHDLRSRPPPPWPSAPPSPPPCGSPPSPAPRRAPSACTLRGAGKFDNRGESKRLQVSLSHPKGRECNKVARRTTCGQGFSWPARNIRLLNGWCIALYNTMLLLDFLGQQGGRRDISAAWRYRNVRQMQL